MAKPWSRGAMSCMSMRRRYTPTPSRPRTASGAISPPGTGEAATLRRLCLRLFPSIALLTRYDSPGQYGGEPLAVRRTRAQHLAHAIALYGCLVKCETQARPCGSDEAAVLQRRH